MSATQGCNDDKAVIETFKEALKQRVGVDIFQAWFVSGISFQVDHDRTTADSNIASACVIIEVQRQFALDRLRRNYLREMRGAAMQAWGKSMEIDIQLAAQPQQVELPLGDDQEGDVDHPGSGSHDADTQQTPDDHTSDQTTTDRSATGKTVAGKIARDSTVPQSSQRKRRTQSISSLVQQTVTERAVPNAKTRKRKRAASGKTPSVRSSANDESLKQPALPIMADDSGNKSSGNKSGAKEDTGTVPKMTLDSFIDGSCNHLAKTAAQMVCEKMGATTSLFLSGPPGVGKTHLMFAIADFMRRRRRVRRVIQLSAESFTNDFISAVSTGSLTAFRGRYRDVDALLIDDVQFLSSKKATLRELQYTVEWLSDRGKTLVFTGSHAPTDISGLTPELAGRMASGLVCPMQTLDTQTRDTLLRRSIEERCELAWPEEIMQEISSVIAGDGRRIHGIVNLVGLLQRMYNRMPTMDEIREFGGEQLRSGKPVVTLSTIERAVAKTFQLDEQALKSKSQARTATEPRMLAMYLSRELTPSALAEIGKFYGGRSHSTAILAVRRVESWLATGKSLGRGAAALSARDALDRVESLLRSG